MDTAARRWIVRIDASGEDEVERALIAVADLPIEAVAEQDGFSEIFFARESDALECAGILNAPPPQLSAPGGGEVFGQHGHPTTQLILNLIPAWIRPNDSVADIGSGTGALAAKAARTARLVVALDVDWPAVKATRSTLGAVPAFTIQGSVDALASQSIDLILANLHLAAWRDIAGEIARIARPDARLLASGFLADQEFEVRGLLAEHGWSVRSTRELEGWLAVMAIRPV